LHVHLIAIGGSGMAPLACLLQAEGHQVTGSDGPLYPPMSDLLAHAGIVPGVGFEAGHLTPRPDLVVVGNAVRRDNPEVLQAEALGVPRLSMPEALARFFLADRQPLLIAGTHGKTTTTAMAAWVYSACGRDPGYLIGGAPLDLPASFRRGGGPRFVIEGDEYNAAFFDRGPKFLHYRPQAAILTGVEYDHADLYPDFAQLRAAFAALVDLIPQHGLLVACADSPVASELAGRARGRVLTYGIEKPALVRLAAPPRASAAGTMVAVESELGNVHLQLQVWGLHNVANALAVFAVACADGLDPGAVAAALGGFHGVRRRQEVRGTAAGVTVVDDFAHHPTAVAATLESLAGRFPGRRLVALFEPRSLSAGRAVFRPEYRAAFGRAGAVVLAPLFHRDRLPEAERLDRAGLAADLAASGCPAIVCDSLEDVLAAALGLLSPGDVAVTMSSGSFGQMPTRLLRALAG